MLYKAVKATLNTKTQILECVCLNEDDKHDVHSEGVSEINFDDVAGVEISCLSGLVITLEDKNKDKYCVNGESAFYTSDGQDPKDSDIESFGKFFCNLIISRNKAN